jgi:hypothetical protein
MGYKQSREGGEAPRSFIEVEVELRSCKVESKLSLGLAWLRPPSIHRRSVGVLGPTAHPGLPLKVFFGVGRCYRL